MKPKTVKQRLTPKTALERIPIAGLYNYLYADNKLERKCWAVILAVSAAATLYYFVPTIMTYLKFTTVFEMQQVMQQPPFPPLHACSSSGFNATVIEKTVADAFAKIENDSRVGLWAKRFGLRDKKLIQDTLLTYITFVPFGGKRIPKATADGLSALVYIGVKALGSKWKGYKSFYEQGMQQCGQIMSDCKFNDKEFPCCPENVKQFNPIPASCFKIDVRK
jgi:hypothetical protein